MLYSMMRLFLERHYHVLAELSMVSLAMMSFCVLLTPSISLGQQPSASSTTTRLIDYVPASTPYVFGYEPGVNHPIQSDPHIKLQELSSSWEQILQRAAQSSDQWTDEQQALWKKVLSFPFPKTQAEWNSAGMTQMPSFWVFGLGLAPMIVVDLPNPTAFDQWLARDDVRFFDGFTPMAHSKGKYYRRGFKRWTLLARRDHHLFSIALLPQSSESVLLSQFLKTKRDRSITPVMMKSMEALPTSSQGSGLIQISSLIDLIFGSSNPILQHSAKGFGLPSPLFKVCEQDMRSLSKIWERVAIGLESSEGQIGILTNFELHPEALAQLNKLKSETFLLPPPDQDTFELMLKLNMGALLSLGSRLGTAWQHNPWTCPLLKGLNRVSSLTQNTQYQQALLLLGPLSRTTFRVRSVKQPQAPLLPTHDSGQRLTGWLELTHPSPSIFIQLLSSFGSIIFPPEALQPSDQLINLSEKNPRFNRFFLTHRPGQLMLSQGSWGTQEHQAQRIYQPKPTLPLEDISTILRLHIPLRLQVWIKSRIEQFKKRQTGSPLQHSKTTQDTVPKEHFKNLALSISRTGLLLRTVLSVKSL